MKATPNYEIRAIIPGREDELHSEEASKRMNSKKNKRNVLRMTLQNEEKRKLKKQILDEIDQLEREYR